MLVFLYLRQKGVCNAQNEIGFDRWCIKIHKGIIKNGCGCIFVDAIDPRLQENHAYDLDAQQALHLSSNVSIPPEMLPHGDDFWMVRDCIWLDDLPYQIHTGREYWLMSQKLKPLAVFVIEPNFQDPQIQAFDQGVERGDFVKRIYRYDNPHGVYTILYSLPEESWRIDAYILMDSVAKKLGFSETIDMLEGSLLGYTDQENEWFLEAWRGRKKAFRGVVR